jgi:hypothetical protein
MSLNSDSQMLHAAAAPPSDCANSAEATGSQRRRRPILNCGTPQAAMRSAARLSMPVPARHVDARDHDGAMTRACSWWVAAAFLALLVVVAAAAERTASATPLVDYSNYTLSVARYYLAATSVSNLALFGGGRDNSGYSNTVDIFNSASGVWTTAILSIARGTLAATSVSNLALFGGG